MSRQGPSRRREGRSSERGTGSRSGRSPVRSSHSSSFRGGQRPEEEGIPRESRKAEGKEDGRSLLLELQRHSAEPYLQEARRVEGKEKTEQLEQPQQRGFEFQLLIGRGSRDGASTSKRLPGYLCRASTKEAKRSLADATCESPQGLKNFHRYYRQVIAPRGGSRGLQHEMLTLSMRLDTLIEGDILTAADVANQRLKSLELIQQGSDPNLALQLELLPRDHLGMVADSEARYAQQQYTAESKLQRQLKGNSAVGKGSWDRRKPPHWR